MIDMTKKYRTRDGRDVRILCVDRDHARYPVVAMIGDWVSALTFDGKANHERDESPNDLIEVVPDMVKWYGVFDDASTPIRLTPTNTRRSIGAWSELVRQRGDL